MTETFAQTFRQLRKERNLTQAGAAALCGVTAVTVWNWEKGRATPWAKNQAAILLKIEEHDETKPKRARIIDNIGELADA